MSGAQTVESDMSLDKPIINFRVDQADKDKISDRADRFGLNVSTYLRDAEAFYGLLAEIHPGMLDVDIKRLAKNKEHVRKILVLLEEV